MKRYHALSKTVERDSETFVRFGLNRVSAVLGGQGACHRWGERQLHQIFKVMVQVGGVRRTRSLINTTKEDSVCQFAVDSHVEIPPLWFSGFPIRHCSFVIQSKKHFASTALQKCEQESVGLKV